MGCLPFTKQEYNLEENECLPALTERSILRNNGLIKAAKELEMQRSDFKFLIFGFYTTLLERIINPLKYGGFRILSSCMFIQFQQNFLFSIFDLIWFDLVLGVLIWFEGFKEADIACCGSGIYRGPNCGIGEFELCSNPNEYLFFDGHHPTEHGYSQFAKLLWDGGEMNVTAPLSLKQLFEIEIEPEFMSISGDNYNGQFKLDEYVRNAEKFSSQ